MHHAKQRPFTSQELNSTGASNLLYPQESARFKVILAQDSGNTFQDNLHVEGDITREIHVVAATTAKTRRKFCILKGNKLSKSVNFKCGFCCEMAHKTETKLMANLLSPRLAHYTPLRVIISHHNFNVKVTRNKTAKQYGVFLTCTNTGAVNLEMAFFA